MITARKPSCGKVTFSQVWLTHSVHREGEGSAFPQCHGVGISPRPLSRFPLPPGQEVDPHPHPRKDVNRLLECIFVRNKCCNIDQDMFPRQDPILECSHMWHRQATVNQHCVTISVNKLSHRLANWDKALWQLFSTSHIKLTLNLWIAFLYYLENFRELISPFIELYKYW